MNECAEFLLTCSKAFDNYRTVADFNVRKIGGAANTSILNGLLGDFTICGNLKSYSKTDHEATFIMNHSIRIEGAFGVLKQGYGKCNVRHSQDCPLLIKRKMLLQT